MELENAIFFSKQSKNMKFSAILPENSVSSSQKPRNIGSLKKGSKKLNSKIKNHISPETKKFKVEEKVSG